MKWTEHFRLLPLVLLLAASACAGSSASESANYVELPSNADAVTTTFEGGTAAELIVKTQAASSDSDVTNEPQSLGEWDESDVLLAVEAFTGVRDSIVVGTTELSALEAWVAPAPLASVADEMTLSLDAIERFAPEARLEYVSFPNLIDVSREGDRIAAISCTERWGLRHGGTWQTVLVDEAFIFDVSGEELLLTEHRVAHDGQRDTPGLTCISPNLGERAVDGARRGIEIMDAIAADPSLAETTNFADSFDGLALESIQAIDKTIDPSHRRVTPVETRYTPVGIDAATGWDFIAVVSVCRHYPEGVFDQDVETGQLRPIEEPAGPGYSAETLVYVHVENKHRDDGGTEYLWDFATNVTEGCWS